MAPQRPEFAQTRRRSGTDGGQDLVAEFPQPAGAARWAEVMARFAARLGAQGRRVVLVTSAAPRSLWKPGLCASWTTSAVGGAVLARPKPSWPRGYGVLFPYRARSAFPFAHRYPPQTWLSVLRPSSQAPSGLLSLEAAEKVLRLRRSSAELPGS